MKVTMRTTTAWLVLAATLWTDYCCHGQSNQTEMPPSNQTEVTPSNQTEVEQSTPTEEPQQTGGLLYFDAPVQEWETLIPGVRQGNGVFLSPDDALIVATSADGTMSAFDPSGTPLWTYGPPSMDSVSAITCSSGVTFAPDYVTYAVIVDEDSAAPMFRIVAVTMSGEELWVSELLQGLPSGTPKVTKEGDYVFVTHNSNSEAVGHFTVLNAAQNGATFFSQTNDNAPFAPLGIYHSPKEGYYTGGENNRNDVLVWSVQPKKNDTNVGEGTTFAFQFPIGFLGQPDNLSYISLGQALDFQAIAPPVFANGGLSLYWGTTRSQFRAWVGQEGLDRYRFNFPRTATASFTRGRVAMQAVFAPLALSDDSSKPFAFGGTAAEEFVRLNFDFSEQLKVVTSSLVKTEAHISPDNLYVYYVEFYGQIHQARFDDLSDNWVHDLQVPVDGEFALSADGSTLYIADVTGRLSAFRVANTPSPPATLSPTGTQTNSPTLSPIAAADGPTKMPAATPTPAAAPTVIVAKTKAPAPEQGSTGGDPPLVISSATFSAGHHDIMLSIAFVAGAILL